ncbi:MAG: haloacid dehalogenase-like hydrolase [Treponema sp.]|nr:haloacid dehalogenase-like hydrolase [Treponema sp.]
MSKKIKSVFILVSFSFLLVFAASGRGNPAKSFSSWNECTAISELKAYVKNVTNKRSPDFIPPEDRIATFDMDGTFVGELYPTYFEYKLLEYRILDDENYKGKASESEISAATAIRNFCQKGEAFPAHFDIIHGTAAAKAYAGMTLKEFDSYVKEFASKKVNGFTGMTYGQSFYKPMLEVFDFLNANGFTCYVVTGSDRFIARALVDSIGIPSNRVIGMDVELKADGQGDAEGVNYVFTPEDTLVRGDKMLIKNLKTNKVKLIAQEIGKVPVLSFGNSGGDTSMHNYCLKNPAYKAKAFMLIADDAERDHANVEKALKLGKQWEAAGYIVISMKNDFKTIYGKNIEKSDFEF